MCVLHFSGISICPIQWSYQDHEDNAIVRKEAYSMYLCLGYKKPFKHRVSSHEFIVCFGFLFFGFSWNVWHQWQTFYSEFQVQKFQFFYEISFQTFSLLKTDMKLQKHKITILLLKCFAPLWLGWCIQYYIPSCSTKTLSRSKNARIVQL